MAFRSAYKAAEIEAAIGHAKDQQTTKVAVINYEDLTDSVTPFTRFKQWIDEMDVIQFKFGSLHDYQEEYPDQEITEDMCEDYAVNSNYYAANGSEYWIQFANAFTEFTMYIRNTATSWNDVLLIDHNKVRWEDLVKVRDNHWLIPGKQYKIKDYVTTAYGGYVQATDFSFEIVVTASSFDTLNENALVHQKSGDTFWDGNHLDSWRIKYSLDNDMSRFYWAVPRNITKENSATIYRRCSMYDLNTGTHRIAWVAISVGGTPTVKDLIYTEKEYPLVGDTISGVFGDEYVGSVNSMTPGKGVIYWMKDDKGNEAPYDFKNIIFGVAYPTKITSYHHTFDDGNGIDLSIIGRAENNKIESCCDLMDGKHVQILNRTVFMAFSSKSVYNNVIGPDNQDNIFSNLNNSESIYDNVIGAKCIENLIECMFRNIIGHGFMYNNANKLIGCSIGNNIHNSSFVDLRYSSVGNNNIITLSNNIQISAYYGNKIFYNNITTDYPAGIPSINANNNPQYIYADSDGVPHVKTFS